MPSYQTIIARAKRYGDTKRGPLRLRFGANIGGIHVEVIDGDVIVRGGMSAVEIEQLTADEAAARLCDIVEAAIHDMRGLQLAREAKG